jgi:hypothetical protein
MCCLTFWVTLSNESGVSTENAIRITCAFEYDSGRKRSYSSCPLRCQPLSSAEGINDRGLTLYPIMPVGQAFRLIQSPSHNYQTLSVPVGKTRSSHGDGIGRHWRRLRICSATSYVTTMYSHSSLENAQQQRHSTDLSFPLLRLLR